MEQERRRERQSHCMHVKSLILTFVESGYEFVDDVL